MEYSNTLSLFIYVPLVLGVLCTLTPKALQRATALLGSLFGLFITIFQTAGVLAGSSTSILEQKIEWLPQMGVALHLRMDSISAWFVILNAATAVLAFALNGQWYRKSPRLFTFFGFFLTAALNGAFLSNDLISFYLFYEAVFIPMIFMVGIWGSESKASAVLRFFIMSLVGSILMLTSILYLVSLGYKATGVYSSELSELIKVTTSLNSSEFFYCFVGFFLAFAIKVPLFPFHGWLKDVYTLAPMPATIWMSAILSKLGVFGFIRYMIPLFPNWMLHYQSPLLWLSAITIVYAAFLAIRSDDPKTLLAYSSISHLGFVMMGVFSLKPGSVQAVILLCVGHTLVSAVLFYLLRMIKDRTSNYHLNHIHGLSKHYPLLFCMFFIAVLGSVSLPGTVNFVGEFLVLIKAYDANPACVVLAGFGVILGAVYMLKLFQQLGLGKLQPNPADESNPRFGSDLSILDGSVIALTLIAIIVLGFQPILILKGNG
jgi:NADH-quinone oxidoreductase subunit M